ncbi:ROK family transcriptional regulator [Occallatibacter riparius]|uniref:ROK family transcriptional regulator n=1 Tax=Occallatibacter riparius TaxID=1002689 RepID=A0A9J7BXF0_9BACT|nr:ROK family transcriptional regulator [Occallatibacter riparius]UWZ85829.1 ROK family transcriptional regulator [Occallatibacter riparius]
MRLSAPPNGARLPYLPYSFTTRIENRVSADVHESDKKMPKTVEASDSQRLVKPEQRELGILRLIHQGTNYSRLDIAKKTGLSASLITSLVRDLIARGLVTENTPISSFVGRKPIPLEIRGDAGYLVGVDIGSYYSHVVITDLNGRIVHKAQIETGIPDGRVAVLRRVFACVHQAIAVSGVQRDLILGAGVAHSGVIDTENGVVLSFPRPGQMAEWKNIPLQSIFENEFKIPCRLEDSVRTMAIAERVFGLGKEISDFLFIEVGMGIGAAFYFNGELYRGAGGKAGEFGHITVDEDGPLCSCGNNGCLESVASCAAIIEAGRTGIERGVDSRIRDFAGGDLNQISVELIARAASENDSLAFRVLQEAASFIAAGLADLVNLLNPRLVIFGGALFRAAPHLLSDPLKRVIRQRSLEKSANDVQLRVSSLGSEAGALGASRVISVAALERLYRSQLHA